MKNEQKGFGLVGILIVIGVITISGSYYYFQNKADELDLKTNSEIIPFSNENETEDVNENFDNEKTKDVGVESTVSNTNTISNTPLWDIHSIFGNIFNG